MNLPTEEGRYLATPKGWAVEESGSNKLLAFVCHFAIHGQLIGGVWTDITMEDREIIGYFYLLKKDGNKNTFTCDSLTKALGWDGHSVASLNDGEWSQTEVQLTIDMEEYNGKTKPKIAFINPKDWEGGGVRKTDASQVKSLDQKYGAIFRAGMAPSTTAPKKPALQPKTGNAVDTAKTTAWNAFLAKWKEFKDANPSASDQERNSKWKCVVEEVYGLGVDQKTLTADQWMKLGAQIQADYSPELGALIPI